MIIANQRIYPVDPEQVGYICILYILSEVPGVVRGIQKKFEFWKKEKFFEFMLYVTSGVPLVPSTNFSQFYPSVGPAIANISIYIYTYMSKELYYNASYK